MEQTSINDIRIDRLPEVRLKDRRLNDTAVLKGKSRRKYVFTDQIDQLIRESYLNHRDAKMRPGIPLLAKRVGIPRWALKKRARAGLGPNEETALEREGTGDSGALCVDER